ncbi:MAG: hypothetical protein JXM70_01345 [Pirellulales bacterium]|nr:hypothetical protein [Pirellulales bacterium]
MIDISVPIIVIDEETKNRYLENPHNPLLGNTDHHKMLFEEEYEFVISQIKLALEKHWNHWTLGECGFSMDKEDHEIDYNLEMKDEGDFFIVEDYFSQDRVVSIEITNEGILSPKLLKTMHEVLTTIDPDYSIAICNDVVNLTDTDGKPYSDFNIFIEKKRILIYSESEELFEKFRIHR